MLGSRVSRPTFIWIRRSHAHWLKHRLYRAISVRRALGFVPDDLHRDPDGYHHFKRNDLD